MLLAAVPVPDADWLPAVLLLIFAVPIGAFLSLYAVVTSFLFHSAREGIPVVVLDFLGFSVNGIALLCLVESTYNRPRYLVVPVAAFVVAVVASAATAFRILRMWKDEDRLASFKIRQSNSQPSEDF